MEATSDHGFPSGICLTPSLRRFLAIAHLTVLLSYVIINRLMSHLGGGMTFDTVLDRYVPFWPAWVFPLRPTPHRCHRRSSQ
jgi:hypothetical protein